MSSFRSTTAARKPWPLSTGGTGELLGTHRGPGVSPRGGGALTWASRAEAQVSSRSWACRLRPRGAQPSPHWAGGGRRLCPAAGRLWREVWQRHRRPGTRRQCTAGQGAPRRGATTSPRAPGAAAAGAAGGSPGRPFSPPPFLSLASPPSCPVSAALPPLPPPSPIGREGRSRRLFPASLQTSAGLASPTRRRAPSSGAAPELPLAARLGSPGGWKVAAGRQAAATRTPQSPSPRLPGRPPLPSSPPARRSVPPARLAAPRRAGAPPALSAPPPPGLFFVLDADSRPAQIGAGLTAALPRRPPGHALPPEDRGARAAAPARGGRGGGRAALPLAGAGQLARPGLPASAARRPVALRRGHLRRAREPGGCPGPPHRRAAPPPRRPARRHRAPGPPPSENP